MECRGDENVDNVLGYVTEIQPMNYAGAASILGPCHVPSSVLVVVMLNMQLSESMALREIDELQ